MNDHDLDRFEQELQALKPGRPPKEFANRLSLAVTNGIRALNPEAEKISEVRRTHFSQLAAQVRFHLRWLAPATVVVLASIAVLRSDLLGPRHTMPGTAAVLTPALKADDVRIDSTLVSSFDAVASLPDGEPVRFRCEEWMDEVQLKDTSRGLVYNQRVPRVTVVPVCFETY